MSSHFSFKVGAPYHGMRLDVFLHGVFKENGEDLSRTRLKNLISSGAVNTKGRKKVLSSTLVQEGQTYTVKIPAVTETDTKPENIPLEIVFEDDHLLIINKPPGMVVHPAPGNYQGTLVNALLYHCGDSLKGISGTKQPGIVHRLDKHTSGLMLAAKTEEAHKKLSEMLSNHDVKRTYWALCWGIPTEQEGIINKPIGRSFNDRQRMAIHSKGKPAVTHYKVIKTFRHASLIECQLQTGRTHQIRLHMASIGHGVVNDPLYGRAPKVYQKWTKTLLDTANLEQGRHCLHSKEISLIHPITQKQISHSIELPEDFANITKLLEYS